MVKGTILGIVSDTHGNIEYGLRAADYLVKRCGADVILHLGDDYCDAEALGYAGYPILAVPGLWCPEYHNGGIANRRIETFDGLRIAMTHADKDLRATERAADVILTGHTHVARVERIGHAVYMNPGHLKSKFDRGEHPSFGLIVIEENGFTCAIHEIDGKARFSKHFPLNHGTNKEAAS